MALRMSLCNSGRSRLRSKGLPMLTSRTAETSGVCGRPECRGTAGSHASSSMKADAAAKLSDFGQQLLARHMLEIDVRMCIVVNHQSAFLPAPG